MPAPTKFFKPFNISNNSPKLSPMAELLVASAKDRFWMTLTKSSVPLIAGINISITLTKAGANKLPKAICKSLIDCPS